MTLPHTFPTAAQGEGQLVVYISGPMTGQPDTGFPMFDAARDFLLAHGHVPISPADHDREVYPGVEQMPGFAAGEPLPNVPDLIGWDLRVIAAEETDAVLFLPGWENSMGAAHERDTATACGKRFFYFDPEGPSMFEERPTRLIGVSGYAQAGKDTIGELLVALGFERIAFADALKAVLYDLNPLDGDQHDAGDLATRVDAYGWERLKGDGTIDSDARSYLQRLGVAVREHVDPDAWVNAALRTVKPGGSYVITDVRFPNEFDEIKRRGGEMWRVERPGTKPVNAHVSETALDDRTFDLLLCNDGTIKDLARAVRFHA